MPYRFTPINPGSSQEQIIAAINKNFAELDGESNAKVYYGKNNQVAVNQGQLANNTGTGTVLSDTAGTPALAMLVDATGTASIRAGRSGVSALDKDVLRIGQVSPGYYGMRINDGTNDTFFAGSDGNGNTVIKVAKAGFDVKTATSDQLIFNSGQDTLKVVKSGTASINPPSSMASGQIVTVTIPHGASVTPAFLVYVNNPVFSIGGYTSGGITSLPSPLFFINGSGTAGVLYNQIARADGTNLYIDFIMLNATSFTGLNAYTWNYRYYILQESAS